MLTLTFEITLKSNYHVGAGYGRGFNVDSALLREADGTPVIRGTGLTGLLHGGAHRLLELPPLERHNRGEVLKRLFGGPESPKRWQISTARPIESRVQDAEDVQRVRIDPRTRRAEPRKLFAQEEGLAGQTFRFTVTFPIGHEAALDDAAFLVAAARYVRRLGRSRRRGLGECAIHLKNASGINARTPDGPSWEDWFLERFKAKWLEGKPVSVAFPEYRPVAEEFTPKDGNPIRVRVIVHLDEPIIIAERGEAGNQYHSLPYIPGSSLLGALATLAAQRCDLADPRDYKDFVALFLRGGILFPTLYPACKHQNNIYPTVLAPLAFQTCSVVPFQEDQEGDGAYPAWDQPESCPECENRLEPVGAFVTLRRLPPYTFTPGHASELHIRVDEATGRVEPGQLYGYTVLNAGQYFVGELVCFGVDAWTRLQEMTGIAEKVPLVWRMGKARRRGYGRVAAWLERCDDKPPAWIQLPLEDRVKDPSQPMSMTLLTDTIIPNLWGQQPLGFTEDWLGEVLGLGPVEVLDAFARVRSVDGFNAHLGLPRWRDTALTAGSVVRFKLQSPPEDWKERLQKLETEGIGVRRNEGFGRVAFNHPIFDNREALGESDISLEEPMRIPGRKKDSFMAWWEEKLEELLPANSMLDPRFATVARWLRMNRDKSPGELSSLLGGLGEPGDLLISAIGEEEYGDRSKPNIFQEEGKEGVKAIRKALEWLKEEHSQNWARGIDRLADWLATLAQKTKE